MNTNFNIFQNHASEVISSFSDAIAKISRKEAPESIAATNILEASLANTLSAMSASLANSVRASSNASLANSISSLSASLATLVGTAGKREASLANSIASMSASLSSALEAVSAGSFANNIAVLRQTLKDQVRKFIKSN